MFFKLLNGLLCGKPPIKIHFMCMDSETLQKQLAFTFEEEAFHRLPETNHLKISSRENVKITILPYRCKYRRQKMKRKLLKLILAGVGVESPTFKSNNMWKTERSVVETQVIN